MDSNGDKKIDEAEGLAALEAFLEDHQGWIPLWDFDFFSLFFFVEDNLELKYKTKRCTSKEMIYILIQIYKLICRMQINCYPNWMCAFQWNILWNLDTSTNANIQQLLISQIFVIYDFVFQEYSGRFLSYDYSRSDISLERSPSTFWPIVFFLFSVQSWPNLIRLQYCNHIIDVGNSYFLKRKKIQL